MTKLSVLDLAPIIEGGDAAQSFRNSLDLAQHVERWGYERYWVAEHHNIPSVASAATAVVIGHIAGGTKTIKVGAGGIMLPNHAPLIIAEQFGTLESLYPGRIELGLGRAPGTDPWTMRALRRNLNSDVDQFPNDVLELMHYLEGPAADQKIHAIPGEGLSIPIWILGSSLYGAQLAAQLGLPYAFASHFAPQQLYSAIEIYRELFRPSARCARPYLMLGYGVFCADTDEEARFIASTTQQAFLNLRAGQPTPLKPPVRGFLDTLSLEQRVVIDSAMSAYAIGSPATVKSQMEAFLRKTGADELMVTTQAFEHRARLRSYELLAGLK